MEIEIAQTVVPCPVCGALVSLLTRDRRTNPEDPPDPFYITHNGTHEIENVQSLGRVYPEVAVISCRSTPS